MSATDVHNPSLEAAAGTVDIDGGQQFTA